MSQDPCAQDVVESMSDWTLDAGVDGVDGLDGGFDGLDGGLVGLDGGLDGGADGGFDGLDALVVWLAVLGVIDEHELSTSDIRPNTATIPILFAERTRGHGTTAKAHGWRRNAERHFMSLGPLGWISGEFHLVYLHSGQCGRGHGV
jgi:hypothetical protein